MGETSLRELRKSRGLTLEALSVLAGGSVDASTVSRWERGLSTPRPETVVRIARALGMSARRLAELTGLARDESWAGDSGSPPAA